MKKYAIVLFILLLVGIGLTAFLFTQDEKLDQTVFLQTTESIQNLQTLDKNLLVFLEQSRFNNDFDHDALLETSYQLSEEFSNLRYDALFEEIESSPTLNQAVINFDEHYASREEELEIYAEMNSTLSSALNETRRLTKQIQSSDLGATTNAVNGLLGNINSQLFSLILGYSEINADALLSQLNDLQIEAPTNTLTLFSEYKNTVISIVNHNANAAKSYKLLSSLQTGQLLDAIEKEYVNYHNQAIKSSHLFRNALIVYGLLLLLALAIFAQQIRRNFLFLEQEVADRTEEIKTAYEELQESQEQLIQSEKMASLGQMVAGVAHEINTPLGYVSSNIETLKLNLDDLGSLLNEIGSLNASVLTKDRDNKLITQQLIKTLKTYKNTEAKELMLESNQLLGDGVYGLKEIAKLVTSLKDFARLDRQTTEKVNLNDGLEISLTIASNHIKENNVEVVREYSALPKVRCVPSKVNQLFLNIITNASQAMGSDGGKLIIKSENLEDQVRITFVDEGIGMDEETKQKMFDPFFTSKEIGAGTGLGMSIAYKIVEAHKGNIHVESTPGIGTAIAITLPVD